MIEPDGRAKESGSEPAPTVSVGPVDLAYEVTGNGPAVLFVAGTGYAGATWPREALADLESEFTVVTYDHRGTGSSSGSEEPYTTRLLAADAIGLLRGLELAPAHVVGHSMGGRVAQWMAIDAPELVRTVTLVASGPGPFPGSVHRSSGIPRGVVVELVERGFEAYIRALQRRTFFTEKFAIQHPEAVDALGDAFWQHRPSLNEYLKHVEARQGHDAVEVVDRIRQPALVIVGELDTHGGDTGSHVEQSRYLADHLRRGELRLVPGARHGVFWERPTETMRIIADWLRRQNEVPHS